MVFFLDKTNFNFVFIDYIEFFAPDCQLHPNLFNSKIENGNSRQVLFFFSNEFYGFYLFDFLVFGINCSIC